MACHFVGTCHRLSEEYKLPDILEDAPADAVLQACVNQPVPQLFVARAGKEERTLSTQCELTAAWRGEDLGDRDVGKKGGPGRGHRDFFALFGVGRAFEGVEPGRAPGELLAS